MRANPGRTPGGTRAARGALAGQRILMVIAPSGFRDEELFEPQQIFTGHGAKVEIASTCATPAEGMLGARVTPDLVLAKVDPYAYAAIVVVGGTGAPAYLWESGLLHAILRRAHAEGIPLGAICLSSAVLARADLLRGRRATVYGEPRAKHELRRGGATYVAQDVVVDQGIVTASGPAATHEFADAIVHEIERSRVPPRAREG